MLVPGFLTPKNHGFLTKTYFGSAFQVMVPKTKVVAVRPSPVASLHDRAVEIFYEIIGGTVDYGEKHSSEHGHDRFGATYSTPLFQGWSSKQPIHLVGHSFGGLTARMLHHLLDIGFFFKSHGADASWVKSITTISSPLNGALAVYALGAKNKQSKGERSSVVPFSPGFCLGIFVHLYDFICPSALKRYLLDFGMDHWTRNASLRDLVCAVFLKSPMFEGADSANVDMAPHVVREHNRQWKTRPDTYYFSFVGKLSNKPSVVNVFNFLSFLFLSFLSFFVGHFKWNHVNRSMPNGEAETRWNSGTDGLVSCLSQSFPHIGPSNSLPPKHRNIKELGELSSSPSPGCWYVLNTNTHHLGIVPFPSSYEHQRSFFIQLFNLLASLPSCNHE